MNPLTEPAEQTGKKLNLIRKYPNEVLLSCMTAAIIYLFVEVKTMGGEIRSYLKEDRIEMIKAIQENTEANKAVKNMLYILNSKTTNRLIE